MSDNSKDRKEAPGATLTASAVHKDDEMDDNPLSRSGILVAMDQFLPKEILAQIASNLSSKDWNSLARANRTCQWKMEPYRKAPQVDIMIYQKGGMLNVRDSSLCFDVSLRHPKGTRHFKSRLGSPEPRKRQSQEEKEAEVNEFYYRNRVNPLDCDKATTSFNLGQAEGIALHLRFLQYHNVVIDHLLVHSREDSHMKAVANQMKGYAKGVDTLDVWSFKKPMAYLPDLINACNPTALDMDSVCWSSGTQALFEMPVVRKELTSLNLECIRSGNHFCGLDDNTLLNLSATMVSLSGCHGVTESGFKAFLKEWIRGEREVRFVFLSNSSYRQLSKSTWRALLCECDRRLVKIEEHDEPMAYSFCATLRRLNDGALAKLWWNMTEIGLNTGILCL